jgi:hypothetical protein
MQPQGIFDCDGGTMSALRGFQIHNQPRPLLGSIEIQSKSCRFRGSVQRRCLRLYELTCAPLIGKVSPDGERSFPWSYRMPPLHEATAYPKSSDFAIDVNVQNRSLPEKMTPLPIK